MKKIFIIVLFVSSLLYAIDVPLNKQQIIKVQEYLNKDKIDYSKFGFSNSDKKQYYKLKVFTNTLSKKKKSQYTLKEAKLAEKALKEFIALENKRYKATKAERRSKRPKTILDYLKNTIDNAKKIKELIKNGADVNKKDFLGNPPIFYTLKDDRDIIFKALMESGANINYKNKKGEPLFVVAGNYNAPKIFKLLIKRGINVNTTGKSGVTALMNASFKGYDKVIKILLDNKANINQQSKQGYTALMNAVYAGHIKTVKLLINNGADVNIETKNQYKNDALQFAFRQKHYEIMKFLVTKGANINKLYYGGNTLLHKVTQNDNNPKIVKFLLELDADPNIKNKEKNISLYYAMEDKTYQEIQDYQNKFLKAIVSILTKAKNKQKVSSSDIKNISSNASKKKKTYVKRYSSLETVKILVKYGAKYNDFDIIYSSMGKKNKDIFRFFIKSGIDINMTKTYKDGRIHTLLTYGYGHTDYKVCKILVDNGIDINKADTSIGYTPLHWSVPYPKSLKYLLDHGADFTIKNKEGLTPMGLCKKQLSYETFRNSKEYNESYRLLKQAEIMKRKKNAK
jgi:ankyrin repeat protein